MKNKFNTLLAGALIMCLLITSFAFQNTKTSTKTISFAASATAVPALIEKYASLGYTVKFMVAESVSTSINPGLSNSSFYRYTADYRDLRGLIVVTLEK